MDNTLPNLPVLRNPQKYILLFLFAVSLILQAWFFPKLLHAADSVWVSTLADGSVSGLTYTDDDILEYDIATGQWSILFDGSASGITGDINAVAHANDGSLIFSLARPQSIAGIGTVDDSDLLRFTPDSNGDYSTGTFELYFDGSDVGLTTSAEDITAVSINPDGSLLISVRGNFSADGVVASAQDVLKFQPSQTGAETSGIWSLFLDGSGVSLSTSTENIWGISPSDNGLAITTLGSFSVTGAQGNGTDIFECIPVLPEPVICGFDIYAEYSASLLNRNLNAIHVNVGETDPVPPTAVDDEYSTNVDIAVTVTADNGILANDVGLEAGSTTIELVSDVSFGTLNLQADGSFDYLPDPDFNGQDSFDYQVSNSIGFSNLATVNLSVVVPGNNSAVSGKILVSALANGVVDGISYTDDDVLSYDPATDAWAILFDGSLFGIRTDINAITVATDGSLIFSLASQQSINGLGLVDDSDLVRFIPAVTGDYTMGDLEFYFDGSDVGLTSAAEDITAVSIDPNGDLLISVRGTFAADGVSARDEDILLFAPTQTGTTTSGIWSIYLDGSDNSLSTSAENIWGISASPGNLSLNTLGNFSVPGASGSSRDVLNCVNSGITPITCDFTVLENFSGSALGRNINALHADLIFDEPEPNPPVAVDDSYDTTENNSLTVDAINGLLNNDADTSPDTSVELLTGVSNGSLSLATDGSFIYTPSTDYTGTDGFSYRAINSIGVSESANVTLLVTDPANNYITQLNFDAGEGNPVDSSGAGNNGVLNGPLYSTETADGSSYSLLFDGVDDEVELGLLTESVQGLTLAAWVNASSFTGSAKDGRIVSRATGLSTNNHFYMLSTIAAGNSAQFRFRVKIDGVTHTLIVTDSSNALSAGIWYHIAGTFDGSTMRIYQNGAEVASLAVAGTLTPATGVSTSIGSQPGGSRHWHGLIDDVQILNQALDASAILGLFTSGTSVIAQDNAYSTLTDTVLTVVAPGVLANDDATDGSGLTASLVEAPVFGTLVLNADGSFSYDPLAAFVGTDTFRYRSTRADGEAGTATVTIGIVANDAPVIAFTTGAIEFDKFVVDDTVDNAHYVGAADYNADGLVDLIATDYTDDTIFLYDQQADGSFNRRVLDASLNGAYPAHISDIDQDGDPDILGGGYLADTVALYLNNGVGLFSKTIVDSNADGIHSMEVVDLDLDGDNDIVATLQNAGDIVWYENTGNLSFIRRNVDVSMPKAKRVTFADFDNDGDLDLTAAADGVNRIAWYENDGNQTFTRRIIDNNLEAAYFVHTDDMDGDGYSDIVAAGKVDNQIVLYRNQTDGTFQKSILDTTARGARSTFAADIDADGRLDAIGNGLQADTISWYRNNGNGTYTTNVVDSNADGAYGVLAHDVDGDGDQDLLLASRDDFSISVYYNNRVHRLNVPSNDSIVLDMSAIQAIALLGNAPTDVIYTLIDTPDIGDLLLNGQALAAGDTFAQADINSAAVIYTRTDGTNNTDTAELLVTLNGTSGPSLTTQLVFSTPN